MQEFVPGINVTTNQGYCYLDSPEEILMARNTKARKKKKTVVRKKSAGARKKKDSMQKRKQ